MDNPIPAAWTDALSLAMERFDTEHRAFWRDAIESDVRLLLGIFIKIPPDDDGANLTLQQVFPELPGGLWAVFDSHTIIDSLTGCIAQTRIHGDEDLVPRSADGESYKLSALGIVTGETNQTKNLTSTTFYLVDRVGCYYTRRFMGGNQGEPECTRGHVDHTEPFEVAEAKAAADPNFHAAHSTLGNLLHACLATPQQLREDFGDNEELSGALELITQLRVLLQPELDPRHPLNPVRAN